MKFDKKKMFRFVIQLFSIAVLIIIDRLIKNVVYDNLRGSGTLVLIKNFLGFTYCENTGAAFSMFSASTNVLSIVTGIALLAGIILLLFIKEKPFIYHICIPLIIAGGGGNLLDRLTRGYVIDYIHTLFIDFPVFNFADCLITCACFALIIYLIYEIITQKEAEGEKTAKEDNND